jgi:hypothetical protein
MTIKEAILKSLSDLQKPSKYMEVHDHIISKGYYEFKVGKTPPATISAQLGNFIRNGDSRVKRIKGKGGGYLYYLTKDEGVIDIDLVNQVSPETKPRSKSKTFSERDLHLLLSSFLKNTGVYSKTIFHEKSKNNKDSHQKWIHPDMVGIRFLHLQNKVSQAFLRSVNRADTFKITSYELKKEINTDYDLKKCFFQAVSNSSWANFGYLVAFGISDSLNDEMERLNQSFGIGIIELSSNPFESKILFPARYKELDFKTIDKLCKINPEFEGFIEKTEKLLTATERYVKSTERELQDFCDDFLEHDSEIEKYCREKHIPFERDIDEEV